MENLSSALKQIVAPAAHKRAENVKETYVPEFARFKLQFIWRNGSSSIPYHSFDRYIGIAGAWYTDEETGMLKLRKFIGSEMVADTFIVATVWANITDDLRTYINGKLNKSYNYQVFKQVRNRQHPVVSPLLKFEDKKLNVGLIRREAYR